MFWSIELLALFLISAVLVSTSSLTNSLNLPKGLRKFSYFTSLPTIGLNIILIVIMLFGKLIAGETLFVGHWIVPLSLLYIALEFAIVLLNSVFKISLHFNYKKQQALN